MLSTPSIFKMPGADISPNNQLEAARQRRFNALRIARGYRHRRHERLNRHRPRASPLASLCID